MAQLASRSPVIRQQLFSAQQLSLSSRNSNRRSTYHIFLYLFRNGSDGVSWNDDVWNDDVWNDDDLMNDDLMNDDLKNDDDLMNYALNYALNYGCIRKYYKSR